MFLFLSIPFLNENFFECVCYNIVDFICSIRIVMQTLLYVEDDKIVARSLQLALAHLYAVEICHTVADAKKKLASQAFDVMLVDYFLDDQLGLDLCRFVRRQMKLLIPIVFITKNNRVDDLAEMLDCGADDFINKPLDIIILKAKLRAISRRLSMDCQKLKTDLWLDERNMLFYFRDIPLVLPKRAFQLLKYLYRRRGEIVDRDEIILHIWAGKDVSSNTVDVHISRMRNILEMKTGELLIDTVHGSGYRLSSG